ncbi:MAG: hypothetical protein KDK70_28250 [Myxococcales bacterium]|nr:hypothetical protein [Myxococcales bacterium]
MFGRKRGARDPRPRGWGIGVGLVLAVGLGASCYHGGERDKDPPPGLPGGLCLAPDGFCQEGTCNRQQNYCYDQLDPCLGFFCGGEERGLCTPDSQGLPNCLCAPGYANDLYPLYCCPSPALGIYDELCEMAGAEGPPAGSGGDAPADSSGGSTG